MSRERSSHPCATVDGPRRRPRSRAAALDLAVERGWDQVTVDDVAARAGISRRTFFNYFSTKDEALFHDAMAWRPGALEAFTASSAPLLDALEELFATQAAQDTPDRDRALRVMRLVDGSPELLPGLLAGSPRASRRWPRPSGAR